MRVFISGATGLLGRAIAARLVELGHQVVALVRPQADTAFLREIGADLTVGSLGEIGANASAFRGCEALVHAAALVAPSAGWDEYRRVNVEGTRALFDAAARAGVSRALYVSSVGVYGTPGQLAGRAIDETAPTDGALNERNFYARSKRQAEAIVRSFHEDGRLGVTIVRPCFVYGEGDRLVIPRLVRLSRPRLGTMVGSGRNHLALVYSGNVADGAVLALTEDAASGRVYNLTTDFPLTQRDVFRLAAAALGHRRVVLPIPHAMARALLRRSSPVRARGLAFLALANPFVSERARRELGWTPRTPHDVALPRAIRWHLAHATEHERG